MIRYGVIVAAVVAAPAALQLFFGEERAPEDGRVSVQPVYAASGSGAASLFNSACGDCHGSYGQGTDNGPMLVHALYAADIFPDTRIRTAIMAGARARHWPFGDMPAIGGLDDNEINALIAFVREAQKANGI